MHQYTPEQRRLYADHLCDMIREWVVRRESDFEIEMERGVEWCRDAISGEQTPRANPTITLTLRINGGAARSEGPPIVRTPPLFRGPGS